MATNEEIIAMCAATQSDVRNICNTLDGIKQFMSKQIDQHTNTNSRLSVIERVQNDMKNSMDNYTSDCTKDRNSQDKRITEVEGFQGRQMKLVAFISTVFSGSVALAVEWFKRG